MTTLWSVKKEKLIYIETNFRIQTNDLKEITEC